MLCHRRIVVWLAVLLTQTAALGGSAARADYRRIAREQTAYIQTHFYDAAAKKYHDTVPVNPRGLPWTTTWGNGVQWRLLVEAVQDDPATYRPVMEAYFQGLQDYWDPQPKNSPPGFNAYCSGPGGSDKYYDDNAWMVLGFLEAYEATHDPKYLQWARQAQAFVLSGWDDKLGGGIYWSLNRQSKNTCDNAPAAVGALRLAALGDTDQSRWGARIVTWVNGTLKDADGLYWDNIALDGSLNKAAWTYNTGLMIEADVLLYRMRGDRQALSQAERSADQAIRTWQNPATGAFTNGADFTHLLCESLLQLYRADRNVRYLNAVRRHAAFGYRYVRDAQNGGFWSGWTIETHQPDEPKSLLQNASDARLFWLLAPYPDVDQLQAGAARALDAGDVSTAEDLLGQAADSDTEAVEPRYRLWRLLLREGKTEAALAQEQKLIALSADPRLMKRLAALGWTWPPTGAPATNPS